jgi:hypothetical protein
MIFAHHPGIFVLPFCGVVFGIYAIIFGAKACRVRKVALTRERFLTGRNAAIAGLVCMALGFSLLVLTAYCWQFIPE